VGNDTFLQSFLGSANDDISGAVPLAALAAHGYAVFLPNERGSTGYGVKLREPVFGDVGGVDFRDLMTGVDHLIATTVADPDRLGVLGFSYGGYLAAWAAARRSRVPPRPRAAPNLSWKPSILINQMALGFMKLLDQRSANRFQENEILVQALASHL
jgi:alpha-beta hydrolase superfamily lysophospholipase